MHKTDCILVSWKELSSQKLIYLPTQKEAHVCLVYPEYTTIQETNFEFDSSNQGVLLLPVQTTNGNEEAHSDQSVYIQVRRSTGKMSSVENQQRIVGTSKCFIIHIQIFYHCKSSKQQRFEQLIYQAQAKAPGFQSIKTLNVG